MSSVIQGRPCWFELFTEDSSASQAFYSKLFGWKIQEFKKGDGPGYPMFAVKDQPIAGITKPPIPELANSWLAYIAVSSLDETIQKIKSQNGKILHEEKMPEVGRWVIAKDLQGAFFAAFEPAPSEKAQPELPMPTPPGFFCWHELMCKNYEEALSFYSSLFDWKKSDAIDMGEMGVYQMFARQTGPMGGMMNITPQMKFPRACWLEYVSVSNVDETIKVAQELGSQIAFPAMEVAGGGRIAGFIDPFGVMFAVWSAPH